MPPVKEGDVVTLQGRVVETVHLGGGVHNVRIQNGETDLWLTTNHIDTFKPEDRPARDKIGRAHV